jgi:RNA 2',3'-cyclic 3'-phosphodiesterase
MGDPYAGIPGRRIFVAVPLSDIARERVETLVAEVRAVADPTRRDVRWVRLEGLHVTLRFIGPTLDDRLPAAGAAVAATAASIVPFEARLRGGGAFPGIDRPRALWLGIGPGDVELGALTARLGEELARRGWPSDDRPFRPHLTLARSDGIAAGAETARRLVAAAADLDVTWTVDRLILFESVTGGGPARYRPLHEAPFDG